MTTLDDSVYRAIEENLQPRREDAATYLVAHRADHLPIARSDLLYLWDEHRTEFLDFAALMNPVGHHHPLVASVVADHARQYGLTAPQGHHLPRWVVEYAKKLSDYFTALDEPSRQVVFTEGQREAVLVAMRLASAGKPVAVVDTGWHDWLPTTGVHRLSPDRWLDAAWPEFGALLLSTMDVTARPVPALRELMLMARTAGVPVIVDESVTGFGRCGVMWGQERIGLIADLVVLGGACGGGYPLGAVIAAPDWFTDGVDVSPQAAHPLICCAGLHTLNVVTMGVLEYMQDSSAILAKGLSELCAQFPHHLRSHHGDGLLRGLQFVSPERAARFPVDARSHNLHIAPAVGDVVVLSPVLITSTNEMTRGVDLISSVLMSWDDADMT